VNITVPLGYDACEAAAAGATAQPKSAHPDYTYVPDSYLPAGNELESGRMTTEEAAAKCSSMPSCEGFTFQASSERGPAEVYFKTAAQGHQRGKGWHTYKKRQELTCSATPPEADTRTITVDIVREEPIVAMLRGFATGPECELLVEAGGNWSTMSRAYTSQGQTSSYRRSYSKNIYPPLEDSESEIMRIVARMFSATRSLTGYSVYPPGQEPLNAVLYRELGDEYRPHCDGACINKPHDVGERIATSILYCKTAELGGHTSFTESTHKVVPVEGDMLLFAYRLKNGRMSREAEHSGCPIRRGQKWIATQWYREGVSEQWNWEDANEKLRGGGSRV